MKNRKESSDMIWDPRIRREGGVKSHLFRAPVIILERLVETPRIINEGAKLPITSLVARNLMIRDLKHYMDT
jgi:hypothetical protein